jgi:chemotaxis protein CheD
MSLNRQRLPIGVVNAAADQEIHLLAGQLYFGKTASRVRTLLGSCVGITLWHPSRGIGGMCHFLLPERQRAADQPLDARFGEEALYVLVEKLSLIGTRPQEYEVNLFGGADTMPDKAGVRFNVGERNIELGWSLIDHYGFAVQQVDVGDNVPRNVAMNMRTGEVAMRRGAPIGWAAA